MNTRIAAPLLLALVATVSGSAVAQWPDHKDPRVPRTGDGKVDVNAPAPRMPDGKPDFSGTWGFGGGGGGGRGNPTPQVSLDEKPPATFGNIGSGFKGGLPLKPESAALLKQRMADNSRDNPDVWCLPLGNQQFNTHPFPRKIVQTPNLMLILYETHMGLRQIFIDGRPLPNNDPQPWFYGYSVGRWEGDTLVVETVGFKEGGWLDVRGNPIGEKGRTIERFRRPNAGTIEIEQTVDDPEHYTRPFTTTITWRLMPDTEIMEMVCTENNQSINHLIPRSN